MTSEQLIYALKTDKLVLIRRYHEEELEYLFYNKYNFLEMKGWGSQIGTIAERALSLIQNPEQWEITMWKEEDYPWSTKMSRNQKYKV